MILYLKSVILVVSASLRWLNYVSGVYFVWVFSLLIGQQDLGHFFRFPSSHWLEYVHCKLYANAEGK